MNRTTIYVKLLMAGFLTFLIVLNISCHTTEKKNSSPTESWSGQMQSIDHSMKEMIPLIYDSKEFSSPDNEKNILAEIDGFSKSVHRISPEKSQTWVGEDPLFNFSLGRFRSDLTRAKESFELGHKEYSRSLLKGVVGHCFRCHTRTDMGPQFQSGSADFSGLKINRLEKADLLVATRRYDDAQQLLESIIGDQKEAEDFPFEVERSLRRYLSLMVRVKKEYQRVIVKLEDLLIKRTVPYYLLEDVKKWKKSLQDWEVSESKKTTSGAPSVVKTSKQLIRKARMEQEYRRDHGADVDYLLATRLLHDGLPHLKKVSDRTEAYLLLGECYEVLGDLGSWNLHEFYFESCVREWPQGPLAKSCYERLEESVYLGYSGSAGIHIPSYEKKRLDEIKNLIEVH